MLHAVRPVPCKPIARHLSWKFDRLVWEPSILGRGWLWICSVVKPIGHIAWVCAEAASGIRCVAFARTFVSACYG
jgi:hypothetical protein